MEAYSANAYFTDAYSVNAYAFGDLPVVGGGTSKRRKKHKLHYYSDPEIPELIEAIPTSAQLDAIIAKASSPIEDTPDDDDDALLHAILLITLQ